MATPDIFGPSQDPSNLADRNVRIWPCSGTAGNIMGKQATLNGCSDDCTIPSNIAHSYAGIGYVFSYYENTELKVPNSYKENFQWSEYLVQKLANSLTNGNIYKLSFNISKAESFQDWPNQLNSKDIDLSYIGALLTNTEQKIPTPTSPIYETYSIKEEQWKNIKVLNKTVLANKGLPPNYCDWMTITGYFKACNDMQYIYIGHFNNDIKQEIGANFECKEKIYTSYYFINDVELEEVSSAEWNIPCQQQNQTCGSVCPDADKFEILAVSEQIKTSENGGPNAPGCNKGRCCTQIFIKRTQTGDWNCHFNFVKLNISIDATSKKVSQLIPISPEAYTQFVNGVPISVYTLCNDQFPEIRSPVTVKAQFFNSTSEIVCEPYPGWWGPEVTSSNLTLACECPCEEISTPAKTRFKFEKDQTNDCCYFLSLDNTNSECDIFMYSIVGDVEVLYENGFDYLAEEEKVFVTPHNNTPPPNTWVKRSPFWDGTRRFTLDYIPLPNDHFLKAGTNSEIARICVPQDGRLYKFNFNLSRVQNGVSGCKSEDYYVKCLPTNTPACCANIHVSQTPAEDDCCFYLFIQTDHDEICKPSYFNIFDITEPGDMNTALVKGKVDYSTGVDDPPYKRFGPYCVKGNRNHNLSVDVCFDDNSTVTVCSTPLNISCSTNDCCDEINVTPGNFSRSLPNRDCCYDFTISTGDGVCSPKSLIIKEGGLVRASFTEATEGAGLGNIVPHLCLPSSQGTHSLVFDFKHQNNQHCYKEITVGCEEDCCPKLHAVVSPDPIVYDDGSTCCYELVLTVDSELPCDLGKLQIVDYGDFLIKEIDESNIPGPRTHHFCVSNTQFNGQSSMKLRIKYLDNNLFKFCETEIEINACSAMKIPTPCSPDNNGGWITMPQEIPIGFWCDAQPPEPRHRCEINFKFAYRKVVNGSETHRDVQVLSYSYNKGCDCEMLRIEQMILAMWKDHDVISAFFDLSEVPNDNQEHCFTDFRVVASDCWERYVPLSDADPALLKRCPTTICCWANFLVCYKRVDNKIVYTRNERISGSDEIPVPCPSPCQPRNCELWTKAGLELGYIPDVSRTERISQPDESTQINIPPCNVSLINNEIKDEVSIKLECEQKGNIKFILSDLLGNIVMQSESVKTSFSIIVPVKVKLQSGVYFLKVTMDDSMLYFNKINIVR